MQDDIRKDRSVDKAELALPGIGFVQHVRARDVGRHEVGRKLDPFEFRVQNLRDRADDFVRHTGCVPLQPQWDMLHLLVIDVHAADDGIAWVRRGRDMCEC